MTKEELYLSILDNIQDGVYYVDIHRKIKFWNKGAEQITGYQADEMLGLECSESKLNHIDEFGNHLCITGCPLFATNIGFLFLEETWFPRMCQQKIFEWKEYVRGKYYGIFSNLS